MAKAYRVGVDRLSVEQMREVEDKLFSLSPLVRHDIRPSCEAYVVYEQEEAFPPPDEFTAAFDLPKQCTVTDVTGWKPNR